LTPKSVMFDRGDESNDSSVNVSCSCRRETSATFLAHCFSRSLLFIRLIFLSHSVSCVVSISKKSPSASNLFLFLLMFCTSLPSGAPPSPAPSVLIHVFSNAFSSSSDGGGGGWKSNCHVSSESATLRRDRRTTQRLLTRVSICTGRQTESRHSAAYFCSDRVRDVAVLILTFRTNAIAELSRRHNGFRTPVSKPICQHASSDKALYDDVWHVTIWAIAIVSRDSFTIILSLRPAMYSCQWSDQSDSAYHLKLNMIGFFHS